MRASHEREGRLGGRREWMRLAGWLAAAAVFAVALAACGPPAPVVQGEVLAEGSGPARLAVLDERRPGEPPLHLDTSRAEIGGVPRPGDRVRVVYRTDGGVHYALAVMNLSRQPESGDSRH